MLIMAMGVSYCGCDFKHPEFNVVNHTNITAHAESYTQGCIWQQLAMATTCHCKRMHADGWIAHVKSTSWIT
jgi:hypothetical protein